MSTFERMLKVLGNADEARCREILGAARGDDESTVGRRRRGRQSRQSMTLSTEALERRQLLALTTFAESTINGGWVTVVAEGGDDVFIQQVASVPQSLYVADNSSFQNRTVVGGPAVGAVAGTLLPGTSVSSLDRIQITSGTLRRDAGVLATGYPMVSESTTRFTLSGDGLDTYGRELTGRISIVQPDGRTEFWDFSNETYNGYFRYFGNPELTSGIGVTVPAKPGDYYPTLIRANGGDSTSAKSSIDVVWNVPQLTNVPTLERVSWYQAYSYIANDYVGAQKTESGVRPATGTSVFLSLPNAAGNGLNPIIPSTFFATLTVDGKTFTVTTGGPGTASNKLYFNGQLDGVIQLEGSVYNPYRSTISGTLLTGTQADGFRRGLQLSMSGSFTLSLDSARYALPAGGAPVTATVFAGQDITAALDVNLVQPGSTFNLDSPVRIAANRSSGINVRAATANFNALASTSGALNVGPAVVDSAQALEQAAAVIELVDGKVNKITIPPGFAGAGYDADNPPVVTIGLPQSLRATAALTSISNGRVVSIDVGSAGTGYTTAPVVIVSAPVGGGRTAQATAAVKDGAVTAFTVTDGGSGYSRPPAVTLRAAAGKDATGVANVVGSLATGSLQITNRGSGYAPNSTIPLEIKGRGTGAAGVARINSSGLVESLEITAGGDGYELVGTQILIPEPAVNPSPVGATAKAIVDPASTRIVGFEITNPGAGYGAVPGVTIAAPLPTFNALRPRADVAAGQVSSIGFDFGTGLVARVTEVSRTTGAIVSAIVPADLPGKKNGGMGYAVGDLVNIDSRVGGKGQGAQFRVLEVDAAGTVLRMEVVTGGAGYSRDEVLAHIGSAGSGYGYTVAPKVWIGRPTKPDGLQATAVATIDNAGRISGITITNKGTGYTAPPVVTIQAVSPVAQAETVKFNTRVGASSYSITLADDPSTTDVVRTTLLVSNSGSLAGNIGGTAAAGSVVIESRQGDVLLEGSVFADKQSYLLQSNPEDQVLMPFRLTTNAKGSSVPTGWIKGGTVAVTLANDLDTPLAGAVAFNDVSLRTQIDSLRIRAARRSGAAINDPFPYQLSVAEFPDAVDSKGNIAIDAVAASSFPIQMRATGDMDFNATLSTAGGLSVVGVNTFTVTAPVSTTMGQIKIDAASIVVRNSLQVTDVRADEAQQDIILNASNGDVIMDGGLVRAINRVVINQSKRVPKPVPFASAETKQAINDFGLASMSVTVPAGVSSDNVNVVLSVTHPSLADLSATLVAPDGSRVPLFATKSLTGANLTGTTLDSEAAAALTAGATPYAGSFRPASSLASVYRTLPEGKWTIEVRDSTTGNTGTLDSFVIVFFDPEGTPGGQVSGTSRIQADTLVVSADGSVGEPSLLVGESGAYLLTDVNTVIGYVGGSFAVSDISDLNVDSLRAGGLVSLRADGVDPVVNAFGQTTVAALRGTLTDVTAIDVSAPNGSIAVDLNTSNSIVVGNADGLRLPLSVRNGKLPSMVAAGSVAIRSVGGSTGGDFVVLDAPLAGSSAKPVRFVTSLTPAGVTYSAGRPGIYASTITANARGSIATALFGAGAPALQFGDRILVANTAAGGDRMNGVYAVMRAGDAGSTWQLMRVADGDTADELPSNTIVAVLEGAEAGAFYRVGYPPLGATPFGTGAITVVPVTLATNIGSLDPNDDLRFVVSTTDGTNSSPGSLGKMIRLRQANAPTPNEDQTTDFLFSSTIAMPIKLTQELPLIEKAFAIDGSKRYGASGTAETIAIDGSRIDTTRTGAAVGLTTVVDGLAFTARSGGLKAEQAGSLSNVILGGFNHGTAVVVDGAQNVQINGIVLGEDINRGRLGNLNGVVVKSASASGAAGVVLRNSRISSTGKAAVSLQGLASGVSLYGNTIGRDGRDNVTGIEVISSGANAIGDTKQLPNAISFNGTGIKLSGAGSTTIVNSVITRNTTDGILITKGTNTIGFGSDAALPTKPAVPVANQIDMNKGWGVRIAADKLGAAQALASQQVIRGNYFVEPEAAKNDITKQNKLGAVGLSAPVTATATRYDGEMLIATKEFSLLPRPADDPTINPVDVGIDPSGNQHFGVGDNLGPSLALQPPVDALGQDQRYGSESAASITLTGTAASTTKAFILKLQDSGSGLLGGTIDKRAFTLTHNSTLLVEGRDYTFRSAGSGPVTLRFEAPAQVPFTLGRYSLTATGRVGTQTLPGVFTGGLLTDKVNNVLQGGPVTFTIELVGAASPANVQAVAGDGEASLTWDQPTNTGESAILSYDVQASTNNGVTWVDVLNTQSQFPARTITGLTNGTSYVFRVAAVTAAGRGAFSTASNPVSPGLLPPAKPAATVTAGSVTLAWAAPVGAVGIQSYAVRESADGGRTWRTSTFTQPLNPGASDLATTVTGLANGSNYIFQVAAVSAVGQGNWSPASDPVLLLAAPTILSVVGGDGRVVLVWTFVVAGTLSIDDYVIQTSSDNGTAWLTIADQVSTATTAAVSVSNGVAYVFRVAAKTAQGQGEWSAQSAIVTPRGPASAPLSVRGTPGDSKVDLTWTAPVSTGGAAITDYIIESSSNSGGTWSTVAEGVSTVPAATVTGLTNGVSYVFRVTARTSFGLGDRSVPSSPVIPIRTASVPLTLAATVGDGQVVLNWATPASNGGAAITDYAVQKSTDGGRTWTDFADGVSTATTATVTSLTNGTSYVFRVAARTIAGLSDWTAASTAVVPLSRASSPRSLQAVAGDGRAVLTWVVPASISGVPVTDYLVQRSVDGGRTWTDVADGVSAVTGATVSGLANGTTYVFRVAAVTAAGTGVWTSATAGVVPKGPASAPLNVQAIGGNGQVSLSWSAPSSIGGSTLRDYVVQSSTDGGSNWSTIVDGVSANTGATVTGLTNGTSYIYRVAAVTDFTTGAYSTASVAVMPLAAPGAVVGLRAIVGNSQVGLVWQAPNNTGGQTVVDYTIEYRVVGTATWVPWVHAASTATSATITGLVANVGYLFRVTTVTSFASGQPMETTEAVVLSQPPTRVTGRAGNGIVALTWLPPRTAGPSRIIDYRVQYSVDGVNWTTAVDGVSAASRATVRGLANGTSYMFRVAAITAQGVGAYSAISARLAPRAR